MQAKLIFWGIIILAIAGGGGWLTYRWVEAELIRKEARAKEAEGRAVSAALRTKITMEALTASEEIAKKRAKERDKANADANLYRVAFEALLKESPQAKEWADGTIPDDVRGLRRKLAGCSADLSMPCPSSSIGTNPRATDEGSNEPRTKGGKRLFTERLTAVQ